MNILDKVWWIAIDKEKVGPLSYIELEKEERVKKSSLVWKKGFEKWTRAEEVEELQPLFEQKKAKILNINDLEEEPYLDDELALEENWKFPLFTFICLCIAMLCILYLWSLYVS